MSINYQDYIIQMDYSNEPIRDILCVDIKAFFASVEAVERKQNPLTALIAVVSKPQNNGGLVLAASPKVKEIYGVKTGTRVYEIPPNSGIQIVEPRMELYLEKNLAIIDIFKRYVPMSDLHIYSIDESFLDVTHSRNLFGTKEEISRRIQRDIWQELGLIAAVGLGDNPLLAKLALDHQAKNDAVNFYLAYWSYENVPTTIWRIQKLSDFWGIGARTANKLQQFGIYNVYDLAHADFNLIKKNFHKIGEQLFFHAHGIDRTILSDVHRPKRNSFSKNQILHRDYTIPCDVEIVIREMTDANASRLRKHKLVTATVRLTIGYSRNSIHSGFNHQMKIEATDSSQKLANHLVHLFRKFYEGFPVRTINISFSNILPKQAQQLNLFESVEDVVNDEQLNQTIDYVREKFGYTSLLHADSLMKGSTVIERSKLLGGHQANIAEPKDRE